MNKFKTAALIALMMIGGAKVGRGQDGGKSDFNSGANKTESSWGNSDIRVLYVNIGAQGFMSVPKDLLMNKPQIIAGFDLSAGFKRNDSKFTTRLGFNINLAGNAQENNDRTRFQEKNALIGATIAQEYDAGKRVSIGLVGKAGYLKSRLEHYGEWADQYGHEFDTHKETKHHGAYFNLGVSVDISTFDAGRVLYNTPGAFFIPHAEVGVATNTINKNISPYFILGIGVKVDCK